MNYTKGKWIAGFNPNVTGPTTPSATPVCGGRDWPYRTVNVGMETIAICPAQDTNRTHEPNIKEAIANAKLIAVAPDMYEALKGWLTHFSTQEGVPPITKSERIIAEVEANQ